MPTSTVFAGIASETKMWAEPSRVIVVPAKAAGVTPLPVTSLLSTRKLKP